jgi:hypothetical protein
MTLKDEMAIRPFALRHSMRSSEEEEAIRPAAPDAEADAVRQVPMPIDALR